MNTAEIYRWITSRTGEGDQSVLVAELNLAAAELWEKSDPLGSLQEVYVRTGDKAVVTLPPYVWQVKGVRHGRGQAVTLYTPRPYYNDNFLRQEFLEWREIGRSPLIQSLSGAGRLTARLAKPNAEPVRVTVTGPDSASNHTSNDLNFGATDIKLETVKAFSDVIEFTKSKITQSDVMLYDVQGSLVGILLASQFRADNVVMRVIDPGITQSAITNTTYCVLYKQRPPTFVEGVDDSVEDTVGRALADMVSAELLQRSKDQGDQGRARVYEKRAAKSMEALTRAEGEAKNQPLRTTTSPYIHIYPGVL